MFSVEQTKNFQKDFSKLPTNVQKKSLKLLEILALDYRDPRLHTKKLKDQMDYSFRVGRNYRCVFFFETGDTITLLALKHRKDIYS